MANPLKAIAAKDWQQARKTYAARGRRLCCEKLRDAGRGTPILATQLDQRVAELTAAGWTIVGSRSVQGTGEIQLQYWRPTNA